MKKRIFSIFMVFTLCFVSVDQVYADAGSVIIAGGSVAGVTAGVIAGPAVVAVFCAMMAFGMNIELTKASQEAGMTKTEFLKNKIQQYCNEAQISANTFNNYILDQANVFQNGAISLTDKAGNLIEKFCNWLFDTEQVSSPSTSISSSVVINGITCPVLMPGESANICNTDGSNTMFLYNSGSKPLAYVFLHSTIPINQGGITHDGYYALYALTPDISAFENLNVSIAWKNYNIQRTTYTDFNNNIYGIDVQILLSGFVSNINIPVYEVGNMTESEGFIDFTNGIEDFAFDIAHNSDVITGDMNQYDVSKGVLNPTQDQTIVIDPKITIPVLEDKDITIDVNEYLEIIQDLIDEGIDNIITAIDDATGVPISIEFDPTQDWDPTIEREDDTDLPVDDDKTPVVPDDRIPIDYDLDPLKFDLKGVFPFCIPWDIKDMLSKLNASPVAPSYTVNWHIPIVNETLTFTIDLSPYNGVADILRKMEVLAFCIGLALITRQMILRG